MNYVNWLWRNSCGIRWNTAVRIVTGIGQVVLGLLMVWLSKRFIDETIRTGTADDVLRMVVLFPDDSKNHPFCYLSAKTKKKNIFLPIYLENWNKNITFAA